jgi:hypothetical protein
MRLVGMAQFTQTSGQDVPIAGCSDKGLLENGRHLLRKFISKKTWVQSNQQTVKRNDCLDN